MKDHENHLQRAGEASLAAHDEWLVALRAPADSDESKAAQSAGDAAWDQAVAELRWHGINGGSSHTQPASEPAAPTIDFSGLERAAANHKSATRTRALVGALNLAVISGLLCAIGYFSGLENGRGEGIEQGKIAAYTSKTFEFDRLDYFYQQAKREVVQEDQLRELELRELERAKKSLEEVAGGAK